MASKGIGANLASYSKNYLKIYVWQIASILLNFLSLFIVLPKLSERPVVYGIYSVCIGTIVFLSYADIGFLGAGYKYASEDFAKRDSDGEVRILGFSYFVLLSLTTVFSVSLLLFSFFPGLVIKDLPAGSEKEIAATLFRILSLSAFIIISQRWLQVVFGVRLEDYRYQRISIVGSALRIASVLYFFRGTVYDVVGYFIFSQFTYVFVLASGIYVIRRRFGYDIRHLLHSIRFSKHEYHIMRSLAYGSFYVTILWILYIEFDPFVISKLMGPQYVAYYTIGLTIFSFLRSLGAMIYGPFQARFNHFVGLDDFAGLKELFLKVITLLAPVVTFTTMSIVVLAKPLVINWVGGSYTPSISLVQLLVVGFIFQFLSQPTNILVISLEKVTYLYVVSTVTVVVYWVGVALTLHLLGLDAFALFRTISLLISAAVYLKIATDFLGMPMLRFLRRIVVPLVPGAFIITAGLSWWGVFLPLGKGASNLLITVASGGLAVIIAVLSYLVCSREFRWYLNGYVASFRFQTMT